MIGEASQSRIERLRIRGAACGTPALRLGVQQQVAAAELRPAGFPPAAVLLIRRMLVARPLRLRREAVDVGWHRAVQEQIAALYARAARPASGRIPPDAGAVFFADRAELLAWLIGWASQAIVESPAWIEGRARQTLYAHRPDVAGLLLEHRREAPAAVFHLHRWGLADQAFAGIRRSEALAILREWAGEFSFGPRLRLLVENFELGLEQASGSLTQTAPQAAAAGPGHEQSSAPSSEPCNAAQLFAGAGGGWREWIVRMALSIHQQPARVRSPAFAVEIERWLEAGLAGPRAKLASAASTINSKFEGTLAQPQPWDSGVARPEANTETAAQKRTVIPESTNRKRPTRRHSTAEATAASEAQHASAADAPEAFQRSSLRDSSGGSASPIGSAANHAQARAPSSTTQPERHQEPEVTADLGAGAETELGGVLFLVNLMEHLDLPDCFEQDWRLASQVGSWGVLELIARVLVDEPGDPIWRVLATLDGREPGELPGRSFRGSARYRIPEKWFGGADHEDLLWRATTKRFQVWTAFGCIVNDLPAPAARGVQRPHHFRTWTKTPFYPLPALEAAGLNPALLRWLRCAMTFIDPRLRAALDLSAGESIAELLLRVPGRVYVTATHVDLILPAHAARLPVRRAGLDLDPGWSPRMGRVVLFHFE